ncbi:MAG: hypothetical protein ACOY0T_26755 [Myxococcota bacterium]
MNERARRHVETDAPPPARRADEASAVGQRAASVEDYPFDPTLLIHEQSGLDRLRCISDRELAGLLYSLYMLQERNRSSAPAPTPSANPPRVGLRVLAMRALGGELGFAAQELATNLLVDESGRENITERALHNFAGAFRRLPRNR